MKILGIDESGRGPVAGPMIMCGYLIDESKLGRLKELGVKDSKLLSPQKRKSLAPKLKKLADDVIVLKITPQEIDRKAHGNLNRLEIAKMQQMINLLQPDKVIIDSPEVNVKKFSEKIRSKLKNKGVALMCENFADRRHREVGAASIIAKVERDREVEKLHKKYGFFGSGYSSDPVTLAFLKNWIKMNNEFPDFVRKSWMTAETIRAESEQKSLGEFTGK